jgi:hypothetical protein
MRGTILEVSSLIYPWQFLGTKSLPMGRCDPNKNNWLWHRLLDAIDNGKVQGYG